MPIYEYECMACGYRHEAIQKMSDDPLVDCPECAKPELKKLISAAGFRLKGGGWYETDFKGGKKKNIAGDNKAAAAPAAKGSDSANNKSSDSTKNSGSGASSGNSGNAKANSSDK